MLIDYLLLNPKEHLALFLMHNRDAQYSSLSKYGIGFNGTESGGGTISGRGITRKLDEVPLAKHLLQPALARLLEQHHNSGTLLVFWQMLKQDWLRPGEPTSSLHPAVVRRACVPVMVKLACDGDERLMPEVFNVFEFLVKNSEGIPDTAMKVFSELRQENAVFNGVRGEFVCKLIKIDLEASWNGTPRSCFAFECLLKLVVGGDRQAEAIATRLIGNPEFQRRDNFEFNIIANIRHVCGTDSSLLKLAVDTYLATPDWQATASSYAPQVVSDYLAAHGGSEPGALVQELASSEPAVRRAAFVRLSQLATSDFIKFVGVIQECKCKRALSEVFDGQERGFVVDATEKVLKQWVEGDASALKEPRIHAAIGILDELAVDPDPEPGDDNDRRVRSGETRDLITGIRARTCYVVAYLSCLRPFLPDAWRLTRRLLEDRSAYVKYCAFAPFFEVLRRRTWDDGVCQEAVSMLWTSFDDSALPAPLRKRVVHAFTYVRDLSETDAERVLNAFAGDKGMEVLYVFFGIFRQDHIATMGPFDCNRFARKLELAIDDGSGDLPLRILRGLWQVLREDPKHTPRVIPYLLRYTQPQHAINGIIDLGMIIVEELLKKTDVASIQNVCKMLINFTHLEQFALRSTDAGLRARYLQSLGKDAMKALYEKDHDGFYQYFDLLGENIILGKAGWLEDDLVTLLTSETDPARLQQIQVFFDRLVAYDARYFGLRQKWLDGTPKVP